MPIPTEADWLSEPWDLDIPYAHQHFAGKNLAEARTLFIENALYFQEDLQHMPGLCFRYYLWAYLEYLLSDDSQGDSDGASCFFGIISCRKKELRSDEKLLTAARQLLQHLQVRQDWYDASIEIYGDFAKKAERGLKLLGY